MHLRSPAEDIPRQARELYAKNAVRYIPDVGYEPVPA
jgi:chemotaxis family two-component system sensor kinase Cph1